MATSWRSASWPSPSARTSEFIDALRRVASGGTVLDAEVVGRMLRGQRRLVDRLTDREREVLALVAAGHSNRPSAEGVRMML